MKVLKFPGAVVLLAAAWALALSAPLWLLRRTAQAVDPKALFSSCCNAATDE